MNKTDLIDVRPYTLADKNFILATWLRGLYYGDTWYREIKKAVFMANYHNFLEIILNRSNTSISVACLKDEPSVILGYAVMRNDQPVLHWVFVKKPWRSIGISKLLIPASTQSVSHLTKTGLGILRNHPSVDFNPFLT